MIEVTMEESPYGDKGKTYVGVLGMIQHWILQLESFRRQNKTKEEREYLEADIRGYRAVLATNCEETASAFIDVKHEARISNDRFANNEEVVEYLKSTGRWKVLPKS